MDQDTNLKIQSFEDLDVWKANQVAKRFVKTLSWNFPMHETFALKSQIIRASRSVTANIAEGYGRFHYQENIQFCRQARGSLFEVLDHIIEAYDCEYISLDELNEFRQMHQKCLLLLNGYIAYLKRKKEGSTKV
ncbi:MAG: four helix bundle protein [Bacteroidia bacterium]